MTNDTLNYQLVASELRSGMEVSPSSGAQATRLSENEQLFRFDVDGEEDALHLLVRGDDEIEAIFYPGSQLEFRRTVRAADFH